MYVFQHSAQGKNVTIFVPPTILEESLITYIPKPIYSTKILSLVSANKGLSNLKLYCIIHNNLFISAKFQPGVRYTFSLYSCSSEAPELLQRWQGYTQELGKDSTVYGKLVLLEETMILCISIADSLSTPSLCYVSHPFLPFSFLPPLRLPQSLPVLSSCQPDSRTGLILSLPGERSRWPTEEASSWATTFTSVMAPISHF